MAHGHDADAPAVYGVTAEFDDPDILVASAKAYLSALNHLHNKLERVTPQL